MLSVHAATGPEMVGELADVVAQQLAEVAETGPTDAELQRSKAQLKAVLLMALESSAVNAEQMARQLLAQGRLIPISELIEAVDAVDPARIKAFAQSLTEETPSVVVIGSGRKSPGQASRIAARFRPREAPIAVAKGAR